MDNVGPVIVPPIQPTEKRCSHGLHLALSVLTLGAWLFVWPGVWLYAHVYNKKARERYTAELAEYNRQLTIRQQTYGGGQ